MASKTVACTDRSNGPATNETSFSEGERATITTLLDCGTLNNREKLASAHMHMYAVTFLLLEVDDCYKVTIIHKMSVLSFYT